MSAGEGIAGRGRDGVAGGQDAGVPDPGPVDAGGQFDHRVQSDSHVISGKDIESFFLIHAPVYEDRDHDQISDRE